jgi:hypothetical protein
MRKKYYFNGNYIVVGRKIFGKIYGKILYSNQINYNKNQKVTMMAETFKEIDQKKIEDLKSWGYFFSE